MVPCDIVIPSPQGGDGRRLPPGWLSTNVAKIVSARIIVITARSRPGRLRLGRLRAEGSPRVALGAGRPGKRALARQLLDPLGLLGRTRERREKCDDVVDVVFGQGEGVDGLVQIGIL